MTPRHEIEKGHECWTVDVPSRPGDGRGGVVVGDVGGRRGWSGSDDQAGLAAEVGGNQEEAADARDGEERGPGGRGDDRQARAFDGGVAIEERGGWSCGAGLEL